MRNLVICVTALLTVLILPLSASAETVLADFNSGSSPNNVGGGLGAWDKDPQDSTQTCRESFDSMIKRGNSGYSLKLDYDVDSPNPAFNGFWMKLNNKNLSQYQTLNLWIKGDSSRGYTERFKIELKTPDGVGKYYITGISSDWQKFSIPLSSFGLGSLHSCDELVIVFEDQVATDKDGTIYIDDISVE
ncbi:MAG: carbohydrate binding domain-containing protein [bacterium]|nr:carbohydrate binding domain-containing protein [bacterium]